MAGIKNRTSNKVAAEAVHSTDTPTLQGFVEDRTESKAQVFTDDAVAYADMDRPHESSRHSTGEYGREQTHTNGMESFWSMMKRGYVDTCLWMSHLHLDRHVREFAGRHNVREADTIEQMRHVAAARTGSWLMYRDLAS